MSVIITHCPIVAAITWELKQTLNPNWQRVEQVINGALVITE